MSISRWVQPLVRDGRRLGSADRPRSDRSGAESGAVAVGVPRPVTLSGLRREQRVGDGSPSVSPLDLR